MKRHSSEGSKGARGSSRGRRRRVDPSLSLFDSKLQKRLIELHAAMDLQAFFKSAVRLLHAAIPCDIVFGVVHDAAGGGCSSTVWDSNCRLLGEEYNPACLSGSRQLSILAAEPSARAWGPNGELLGGKKTESFPFLIPSVHGVPMRHAIALFFWNESADIVDLLLAPHRGPQWPSISSTEMATVHALYPHIETAFRRLSRLQNATTVRRGLEEVVSMLPLSTILLDWHLSPLYCNAAARRAAALWSGIDPQLKLLGRKLKVPGDLLNALEDMRLKRVAGSIFRERIVAHSSVPGFKARLSMRTLRAPHRGRPSFVIHFESADATQNGKLDTLTRLSPRERELALMVNEGKSNQEIADALGRQLSTVKSELYSVFKKLEIPSRARLMALLR